MAYSRPGWSIDDLQFSSRYGSLRIDVYRDFEVTDEHINSPMALLLLLIVRVPRGWMG